MLPFRITSFITGFMFILFSHAFAQWQAQDPSFSLRSKLAGEHNIRQTFIKMRNITYG